MRKSNPTTIDPKKALKLAARSAALAATLLIVGAAVVQAGVEFDANREVVLPSENVHYAPINPKIKMGAAYGDRGTGAHGSFGRFSANFITPLHSHSGAYHGIVIKGTMTNPFKGESAPKRMKAGSYWYVPAGAAHATACVSPDPCEFYFHAAEKFDFLPAK